MARPRRVWPCWSTGSARRAAALAKGFDAVDGVEVVNDVVFTQVMFRLSTDERTAELGRRLLADGTCVVTPAVWHGHAVQRCAVSNWSTTEADVDATVDAVRRVGRRPLAGCVEDSATLSPVLEAPRDELRPVSPGFVHGR